MFKANGWRCSVDEMNDINTLPRCGQLVQVDGRERKRFGFGSAARKAPGRGVHYLFVPFRSRTGRREILLPALLASFHAKVHAHQHKTTKLPAALPLAYDEVQLS